MDTCPVCRENMRSIETDSRFLSPLPEVPARPWWPARWVPALVAATAVIVVMVLPRGPRGLHADAVVCTELRWTDQATPHSTANLACR